MLILIKGAGNEELLGPLPNRCPCSPLKSPNFFGRWAKSLLRLTGPNVSNPALRDMPCCSVVGAIIVPLSILNPSLED